MLCARQAAYCTSCHVMLTSKSVQCYCTYCISTCCSCAAPMQETYPCLEAPDCATWACYAHAGWPDLLFLLSLRVHQSPTAIAVTCSPMLFDLHDTHSQHCHVRIGRYEFTHFPACSAAMKQTRSVSRLYKSFLPVLSKTENHCNCAGGARGKQA